jgi:hypothetical protein
MFKIRREQKEAFAAAFDQPVTPCTTCLVVRFVDIEGLYAGGVDDRKDKPDGTTKGASRVPGYASLDDKGRIYTNRDLDGSWKRDTQGIVITVRVDPPSVAIPPGTQIEWSFEDPDDPSNEDPRMHRDAARILDPNDYDTSGKKTAAKGGDNNPYKDKDGKPTGRATPAFAQAEAKYAFSGDKTDIDPATRLSKVRFNVSDTAGDNFKVTAKITPKAPITTTTPAVTGIMTVWHRVDIEYVKMASAEDLPLAELAIHFEKAFAQVDITEKRVVTGQADRPFMGKDDSSADFMCDLYCLRSPGEFTHEKDPGWFFIVAANRYRPEKHGSVLFEGMAFAHKRWVRLPKGTFLTDLPKSVRIFNWDRVKSLSHPWPDNRDLFTAFELEAPVFKDGIWWLPIEPHDFHLVNDPDNSFLDADLVTYGFGEGALVPVQVLSEDEKVNYAAGISPGGFKDAKGHSWFAGRVIVFTKIAPPETRITTLCHELCHAFDNAHKCGNWNWVDAQARTACAMCYTRAFVLDDRSPRRAIRWTQNRRAADFCAEHLKHMRGYHLQDNPALGWK